MNKGKKARNRNMLISESLITIHRFNYSFQKTPAPNSNPFHFPSAPSHGRRVDRRPCLDPNHLCIYLRSDPDNLSLEKNTLVETRVTERMTFTAARSEHYWRRRPVFPHPSIFGLRAFRGLHGLHWQCRVRGMLCMAGRT